MTPFEVRDVVCPHLRIFIYGPNGVGKTQLAWTFPGKKLFIDSAGNPETLVKLGDRPNWDVIDAPKKWSQWVLFLKDPILDQYPVLVWDSITGTTRDLLVESVAQYPRKRESPEQPAMQDYGLVGERIKVITSSLTDRRNKQDIIAIAHETLKVVKGENPLNPEAEYYGQPSVPGQTPSHILSLFPEQIYMDTLNGKRTAFFGKRNVFPAATRLLDADKPIADPDLSKIYQKFITATTLGIHPSN